MAPVAPLLGYATVQEVETYLMKNNCQIVIAIYLVLGAIIKCLNATTIPDIKIKNSITETPKEISKHFISFFAKIGHTIANSI